MTEEGRADMQRDTMHGRHKHTQAHTREEEEEEEESLAALCVS